MFLQVLWLSLICLIFLSTKSGGGTSFFQVVTFFKKTPLWGNPGIIQFSRCLPPNDPIAKMLIFQMSSLFSILPILCVILFFLGRAHLCSPIHVSWTHFLYSAYTLNLLFYFFYHLGSRTYWILWFIALDMGHLYIFLIFYVFRMQVWCFVDLCTSVWSLWLLELEWKHFGSDS